jgi:hypothetical protein
MVHREIELDEESDQILTDLAEDHAGDVSAALSDLLHSRKAVEEFVEECEQAQRESLLAQKERSEREFASGRSIAWEEIRRRNRL